MRCENIKEGKSCQAELRPSDAFCPQCGKTVSEQDFKKVSCPRCLEGVLVEGQNYCSNCKWKIDQSIFKDVPVLGNGPKTPIQNENVASSSVDGQNQSNSNTDSAHLADDVTNGNIPVSNYASSLPSGQEPQTSNSGFVFGQGKFHSKKEDIDITMPNAAQLPWFIQLISQNQNRNPFEYSAIFKDLNCNTHSTIHPADHLRGHTNVETGVGESNAKNIANTFQDDVKTDSDVSDDESATSSGTDIQDEHTKRNRPSKKTRDRHKKQQNAGIDMSEAETENDQKDSDSGDRGNKDKTENVDTNNKKVDNSKENSSSEGQQQPQKENIQITSPNTDKKDEKESKNDANFQAKSEQGTENSITQENQNAEKCDNNSTGASSSQKDSTQIPAGNEHQDKSHKDDNSDRKRSYAETVASGSSTEEKFSKIKGSSVEVWFHAVLSPTIMQNSEKDSVSIVFGNFTNGPWKEKNRYTMNIDKSPTGNKKDGYVVYCKTLKLKKEELKYPLLYKYCVTKNQSDVWEYFTCDGRLSDKQGTARTLNVPGDLDKDVYHCYDGVVREFPDTKNKSLWKSIKETVKDFFGFHDYQKLLEKDAEVTAIAFFPKWQLKAFNSDGVNGEEMLSQIKCIVNGIRNRYQKKAQLWSTTESFDKAIAGFFHSKMTRMIQELSQRNSTKETNNQGRILCLVTALTITSIVQKYGINLDTKSCSLLCESLLPFPDYKNQTLPDVEGLKTYFSKPSLREVGELVLKFSGELAERTRNPCWMYCVPVVHFLLEKTKPFETSCSIKHRSQDPVWWGVDIYKGKQDRFQEKSTQWDRIVGKFYPQFIKENIGESSTISDKKLQVNSIDIQYNRRFKSTIPVGIPPGKPINEVLDRLLPYFDVDYLLPRTFMTTLKLYELEEAILSCAFPVDVILACIYFYMTKWADVAHLRKMLNMVSKQGSKREAVLSLGELKNARRAYIIARDVLTEKPVYYKSMQISAFEVFLIHVHFFDKIKDGLKGKNTNEKDLNFGEDHWFIYREQKQILTNWLQKEPFDYHEFEYLKRWNDALTVEVPIGKIKESYMKSMLHVLKTTLEGLLLHGKGGKIVENYCKHSTEFCCEMQDVLSNIALKALQGIKNFDYKMFGEDVQMIQFGKLLSDLFLKSSASKNLKDAHSCMEHVLSFTSFPLFIEIFYNYETVLKPECQQSLRNFMEVIHNVIQSVEDSSILIKDLKQILHSGESFQKIVNLVDANKNDVITTLTIRQVELEAFENTREILKKFVAFCLHCSADVTDLDENLKRFENVDEFHLYSVVQTLSLEDRQKINEYRPTVIAFQFTNEKTDLVRNINEHCKSLLFMKMWEKTGKALAKERAHSLSVEEVFKDVWEPTCNEWNSFCRKLKTGDMLFSEFDHFFKNTNPENLKEELQLIAGGGDDNWILERLDQVEKHKNLRNYRYGALIILEVVKEYELEGDFEQIQAVLELTTGTDTSMNKLDHSLLDTCSILKLVDEERANSLKAFIKCKPLVKWLKESMQSGLRELKVFVDLVSISAVEGDMNIGMVDCLHSATTGYASLIFNLEKHCDAKVFLQKCQEVWKELAANPKLPEQLISTNQKLAWLKTVEKSHGSVEVSSLSQAAAINNRGIYRVGHLKKDKVLKKPALHDVFELKITEDEKDPLPRSRYTYQQLHDLQSRLMLVAGKAAKGKDDVDRFMVILDSVLRLSNIFMKLIAEGCVLFAQWHVNFMCDKSRPVCAYLNFGYGKDTHTIKGKVDNAKEDVSFIIPKLAKFLEECHKKWMDYIAEKRGRYHLLNLFTVDQMVILQQELVKIGSDTEPSDLIYPLLSAVKRGCTKEDLLTAMARAKSDVEGFNSNENDDDEMQYSSEGSEEFKEEEHYGIKTQKFIDAMIESGFPLELARRALDSIDVEKIDEGIVWCLDNEDDYLAEEHNNLISKPENKEKEENITFPGWIQSDQSLQSITAGLVGQMDIGSQEKPTDRLLRDLEELWDRFLNSISSSVSDYLSVEHLGMILDRLSEQETFEVNRTLHTSFKEGEPNLVICPQSEIYNTLLSVYSHEFDEPLPQSDEVLLCSSHTTLDMLEIFWRRALFADNNKVHCLVNADLLDYDVSDKGEKSLERHVKNADCKGKKYKLVVICSSENEYKSRIVAALDKYHRPHVATNIQSVRMYLLNKLKVGQTEGIKPASTVDIERCSVRIVKSWRAGVGKTLYKKRMVTKLQNILTEEQRLKSCDVTIPLHEKTISLDSIMNRLLEETLPPKCQQPRIFHIDIAHEVQEGVDALLFQLLVLGCLGHSSGHVWRKSDLDYYIIESMPLLARDSDMQEGILKCVHHCLDILPDIICRSPQESLDISRWRKFPKNYSDHDLLFDRIEFRSDVFQRPYQYLMRLDANRKLDDVQPNIPEGTTDQCLETLLRHCGIQDPSWAEIHHFVSFLNKQLQDFEVSMFCGAAAGEDLPGFSKFVLRFLIQMSRDFSTRSLKVSEESPMQMLERQIQEDEEGQEEDEELVLQLYQMRRTWETSPHPYLFFNPDHHSMTFLGFNIDRRTGNLIDLQTRNVLEQKIMQHNLFDALIRNKVNLAENFDALPRAEKIEKLCNVMGQKFPHDPDDSYELTTDNVKKILAIYMRFRCEIPVIIMGETGCGKTRLIKFMCSLQKPPGVEVQNMILMKVHGGTREVDIVNKVREAKELAQKNAAEYPFMDTVLFFDEANTTEAIGVIKEIMCDKSLGGKSIVLHERLKIVAACNPYRKHSEELIKRLEKAGLGYHVDADNTTDRLGRVPMRRLVYRVQPLPQSMLPLVWDFGQLDTNVEEMYIRQMVLRYIRNDQLPDLQGLDTVASRILTVSQEFMRNQQDECSFVSLRDVERVLEVMTWFYRQENKLLFQQMNAKFVKDFDFESSDSEEEDDAGRQQPLNNLTRSLVLSLGVCYHACLKNREEYRDTVAQHFRPPLQLQGGAGQILEEIDSCQSVFLDNVEVANNIAKNQALKENVFMMIVCIELRIPMFLVGKPGSSKSLAKTIVADAMQGNSAHTDLFKAYKQVQMVSFQCSPLSTPDGIVGTFKQCAAYQKDKDLNRFVSIVVLDEIGLAEDSPRMPLKTLHPLLEDGCTDDEKPDPYKKVAFIGISNWALDPAKMNRGILVQREVPDKTELVNSANGICSTDENVLNILNPMFSALAASYLQLFKESTEMREFFGLRDFYSLIKMLSGFVKKSGHKKPTWPQLKHAILRNFGGLENVKPLDVFYNKVSTIVSRQDKRGENDPDCTSAGMIQACLVGENRTDSESRYLLLLTENYGALSILQQKILTMDNPVVIFGSSFPSDQEYTQVCRNINRIKVCMETGSTVILLNLENLYESLYDALNQYYVYFGGEKYVDLGLGTHRVKCRVHEQFRLIVVAEKQIVYDNFPIPLINRLEKHFLSLTTMLTDVQLQLTHELQIWAQSFCKDTTPAYRYIKKEAKKIGDCFMGYHADTCAAIILHVCQERKCDDDGISQIQKEILADAQSILLWCATPATVWEQDTYIFTTYFREQHHDSLADYLHFKMVERQHPNIFAQITTNSKLLSSADIDDLCKCIPISKENITLLTLQSFDTEQQFSRNIKFCLEGGNNADILLIVQCDCGDQNADLIACAQYTVQEALHHDRGETTHDVHVLFLVQLPGIAGGCFTGFQCGLWHSVHIDDLHPSPEDIPSVADMHGKSVSTLLKPSDVIKTKEERNGSEGNEIDLNDIVLYERNEDVLRPKRHFDINHLILKCVQPALAKVKDQEKDSPRGTERLKLVLGLLQQTTDLSGRLLDALAFHLNNILLEKDQQLGPFTNDWLSAEAAKVGNINKAGTFRKFAVQCLHSKAIPILAGIIAFFDTNRNLNILTNNDFQSWQVDLWFQIFNSFEITQLKYSNIVSPSRRTELQEVTVRSTALEGRVFTALMPFSWLIYRQIDETLKAIKDESQGDFYEILRKATDIFAELPLGKLLLYINGGNPLDILQAYVFDFVHMVYPVQSDDECKIVCENIIIGCRQMMKGEFGKLLPSLFGCHMAFLTHAARFHNFSYLMTIWPECSEEILEQKNENTYTISECSEEILEQKNENTYLISEEEITIDVLAVHLLLKKLEPKKEGKNTQTDPNTQADLNTHTDRKKWLLQVYDYRPIVERILSLNQTESNDTLFGERCKKEIQEARFKWTRAVIVKLFIEHILPPNNEDQLPGIRCMPLWMTLGENADLKTIQTLDQMEKFLKSCNRKVVTKYFGDHLKCVACDNPVQGAPVTLPCQHILCRKCFDDFVSLEELECIECHTDFPTDFNPDETPENSWKIKKYQDYRKRSNSFFMEVVSQLCFAEGKPPSEEVINKLLSYITGHRRGRKGERIVSRELTIFDDSFDPTPVVRSFLLQQLMHTSGEQVDNYLMTYFQHTNQLLEEDGGQTQSLELCLLILQCLEDSFHQQHSKRFSSLNQNYSEVMENNDEAGIIKDLLIGATPKLCTEIDTLIKIKNIANTRFALSIVAKYIHDMYGTAQRNRRTNTHIRRMFAAAAELCDDCGSPWPRLYFVKQLCRCYSIDSYYSVLKVSDVSFLQWVVLPQLTVEKVNECFDRYILCGETYTQIRETIVETIMNKDDTHLADLLQKCQQDWKTRVMVRLALHRDITMNLVKGEQHNFPEEGVLYLKQIIMNNQSLLKNRELTEDILENTVWKLDAQRNVVPNMDLAHQNLTCLLTHFLVLMREIPGKTTLVTPLQSLCLQPHTMLESYLPTMPEDEVADLKEALLAARATNPDENPVFYRCPNGHPYVIGDCGRPYEEDKCRTCGKFIGGKSHRLRSDNVKDEGKDRTETGHVLGKATDLGSVVAPERKLDRASFSILRLMTHISMYIGANVNPQALCYSIKPPIEEEEVPGYLLEHIDVDLNMIQAALGKNKDDVLILIHYILSQIMRSQDMAALAHGFNNAICGLKSREGRAEWEELFVGKYIKPVLQNMEDILTISNNRILNDKRLASDQLLQILYETKTADEDQDIQNLQNIPAMWRYKSRISIDHLMQTLNTSKQTCPVLRLFLKEEHHLRAIRLAPNILRLQKLLIQKYNKKLDRSEANTLKIIDVKEHMSEDRKLEEFEELLADYVEAWECVRESLETYACTGSETLLSINRDFCRTRINENTPLSYLLPTHKQAGLCSYILLLFLIEKQNQFMSNYCRQSNIREDSLPKVHVKDISSAHLISYHPDRDLLPMVLANCNYSFEVGQGTRVEYNFTNLERQLMDRFLFSKSVVVSTQEIETFTYRAESTNALVFKVLSHRIKQERLGPSVQNQINKEIRNKSFPDLCESLDKLDIAISFLKSVGAHPESSLNEFMVNTLKMDNPFPSSKAQQVCNCKHTMSWWVTLALERTRRQAKYSGDAFEGLAENLKETLTDEQKTKVEEILEYMPLEHIDVLVYLVFECIVLNIDVPQNKDEDDVLDISQISLCDTLTAYVEASPYETDALVDSTLKTAISRLPSDPKDEQRIITGQSVAFWKLINQIFINKQPQRY